MTGLIERGDEESGAIFDQDDRYRYLLWRSVRQPRLAMRSTERALLFIGLNPSTADERQNDPTIRRCLGYAALWGFTRYVMGNLFGWRSTDPQGLRKTDLPIGSENDRLLCAAAVTAERVVVGWGCHGLWKDRDLEVLSALARAGVDCFCLGRNRDGSPVHPLYQRKEAGLIPYIGR